MKDLETSTKLTVLQDEVLSLQKIIFSSLLLLHENGTLHVPCESICGHVDQAMQNLHYASRE
jgi:hypothetical protein